MKVLVIGLGSMGKRRIRLIRKYDETIVVIGVDTSEERRKTCEAEWGVATYSHIEDAISSTHIDCAFVCTSPLSHSGIITKCLSNGLHVFTELNLVADGYKENITLAEKNNLTLFLSSTFLYRDEIKFIRNQTLQTNSVLNYTYHVGQYLPDWHPWENYNNFFVGDKRSNACREIFAIELPWLLEVFGKVTRLNVIKDKMSALRIDYPDNYLVLLQHSTGCKGTLAVDIVSRKAVRNLEVFGEELYIHWDGSPNGLFMYDSETKLDNNIRLYGEIDHLDNYSSNVIENAYMCEVQEFFKVLQGQAIQSYSFEKDIEVIALINRIESW